MTGMKDTQDEAKEDGWGPGDMQSYRHYQGICLLSKE